MYDYDDEQAVYEADAHAWSFVAGLVIGLAGGAIAALLYAPASGRDARSYVAERARSGRERAAAMVDRGVQTVSDGKQVIHEGREVLSSALREGREAYEHARASEAL